MNVLCIDPGPHVGVATWTDKHDEVTGVSVHRFIEKHDAWETNPAAFYNVALNWIKWADVVVCEDFIISGQRAKEANVTVEMIGVLRYLAIINGKKFVGQRPGAYKFAGSDKLKRLGWYTPGSDHARSASGHLVLYLAENSLIDRARLLPSSAGEGGAC